MLVQFYMLINLGIVAFVTATTLLVITHQDEAGTRRRGLMSNLKLFIRMHGLDGDGASDRRLGRNMRHHLELHFDNEQVRPAPGPFHIAPRAPL